MTASLNNSLAASIGVIATDVGNAKWLLVRAFCLRLNSQDKLRCNYHALIKMSGIGTYLMTLIT